MENVPGRKLSGGLPIVTTVQGVDHVASAGCLVTDGHSSYLLTSRHVAGDPGNTIAARIGGKDVKLGKVSDRQLGIVPFKQLYESWPGDNLFRQRRRGAHRSTRRQSVERRDRSARDPRTAG
jgi:hypothetical protein